MSKEEVLTAIRKLFSNRDATPSQTLEDLEYLVEEIEIMIDAVKGDIKKNG